MTRCNELDAVRGVLLLVMAATHLPTGLNPYADQPFGYVSAAEGFVFLSSFLVGSIYSPLLLERGVQYVRERLWQRARKLYGFHLALLVFAFTVVAAIAHLWHSQGLHNYLLFYFRAPAWAMVSAPLLLYQPPLMDILPMYIVFLLLTPMLLQLAARRGWWPLLTLSALLWGAAQLHASHLLYGALRLTGFPLPHDAWSAFDWLAWQLVWVAGLWLGSGQRRRQQLAAQAPRLGLRGYLRSTRPYVLLLTAMVAALFLCSRHHLGGPLAPIDINSPLVDKWKLGPLRIANFAAIGFIVSQLVLPALRWLRVAVLELLGRASLQVFTAHIPVCILADGLLDSGIGFGSIAQQACMLALMLAVMLLVAWRTDAPRRTAALASARRAAGPPRAAPVRVQNRD